MHNTPDDVFRDVIIDDATGCWLHQSRDLNQFGHARMRVCMDRIGVHRLAYAVSRGLTLYELERIPVVMHSCDNPICVHPLHLIAGTKGDNNRDCAAKGRNAIPVKVRMTDQQDIERARQLRCEGYSYASIGAMMGYTWSTVRRRVLGVSM